MTCLECGHTVEGEKAPMGWVLLAAARWGETAYYRDRERLAYTLFSRLDDSQGREAVALCPLCAKQFAIEWL